MDSYKPPHTEMTFQVVIVTTIEKIRQQRTQENYQQTTHLDIKTECLAYHHLLVWYPQHILCTTGTWWILVRWNVLDPDCVQTREQPPNLGWCHLSFLLWNVHHRQNGHHQRDLQWEISKQRTSYKLNNLISLTDEWVLNRAEGAEIVRKVEKCKKSQMLN